MTQCFIQNFGGEGTIINLSSLAAVVLAPGSSAYSSSKLALMNLAQNLNLGT